MRTSHHRRSIVFVFWSEVGVAARDSLAANQERKVSMQKVSSRVPIGLITAAVAGVMFLGSAAQAATVLVPAVNLGTLISQRGSIQVGDKLFSNFTYTPTGDMPTAGNVNVAGILSNAGNLGIEFIGAFADTAASAGGSDAFITYRVTVTDPNWRITDAHLDSNLDSGGSVGSGKITETFTPVVPPVPPLLSFTTNFTANNNSVSQIHDNYVWGLPGYTSIDVQKDILINTTSGVAVTMSFVDQTFSQTPVVPLPAAAWAGFSMLGGLGFFGAVRRRRIG